jgi:hypothetical protein
MADFKTEIKGSLETELDSNTFIMEIINRFKEAIRQSIISPGVESVVIMDIFPSVLVPATENEPEHMVSTGEPLTSQQITQVQMACIKHIGVPVDVSPLQMVVYMINFLRGT